MKLRAGESVPDLRYINKQIAVADIARVLDLRFGANGLIHCWHPDRHQHGDRTASVGIRKTNNTVKCFGCGQGPFGPTDLVMNVLGLANPADAACWIAKHFDVPYLPPGKHLVQPPRHNFQYGLEGDIGLLVFSGIWAKLSPPARALVPVLLNLADHDIETKSLLARVSYRALSRYSGIVSPNAIKKALEELKQIGWLSAVASPRTADSAPMRETSVYLITPRSDDVVELANAQFAQQRREVEIERNIRANTKARRRRAVLLSKDSLFLE